MNFTMYVRQVLPVNDYCWLYPTARMRIRLLEPLWESGVSQTSASPTGTRNIYQKIKAAVFISKLQEPLQFLVVDRLKHTAT